MPECAERKFSLAIAYALSSCALLSLAFALPHGTPQLVVIGLGLFLAVGTSGPAGAMVANLTPQPIHGTAFAMLTLVNNLLGIAAGPLVTGLLADQLGLAKAFQLVPLISVAAAAVFYFAKRHYLADVQRVGSRGGRASADRRRLRLNAFRTLAGRSVPGLYASVVVAIAARSLASHYNAPVMLFALLLGIAIHFLY